MATHEKNGYSTSKKRNHHYPYSNLESAGSGMERVDGEEAGVLPTDQPCIISYSKYEKLYFNFKVE